jgi:hypothetical protein
MKKMEIKYSLKNGIFADVELKNKIFLFIISSIILIIGLCIGIIPAAGGIFAGRIILIINDNAGKIILGFVFGLYMIVLIILCLLRIKIIKYFFHFGLETDAEIIDTHYCNNEQGFVYIYTIDNIKYKIRTYYEKLLPEVFPNYEYKIISNYKKGDIIKILVNPKDHKDFILKDQYLDRI